MHLQPWPEAAASTAALKSSSCEDGCIVEERVGGGGGVVVLVGVAVSLDASEQRKRWMWEEQGRRWGGD